MCSTASDAAGSAARFRPDRLEVIFRPEEAVTPETVGQPGVVKQIRRIETFDIRRWRVEDIQNAETSAQSRHEAAQVKTEIEIVGQELAHPPVSAGIIVIVVDEIRRQARIDISRGARPGGASVEAQSRQASQGTGLANVVHVRLELPELTHVARTIVDVKLRQVD